MRNTLWAAGVAAMVCAGPALADTLNGDATQNLMSGNTAMGSGIIAFYDQDGTVRAKGGPGYLHGKWWVDRSGRHCVMWEGAIRESCLAVRPNGSDKTYEILKREHPVGMITVLEGNPHQL